jgi:two-component system cell cycle sensor histidine kinase/response regulator CckA
MTDLHQLFDRSPDLFCTHDLEGNIRSANPAACTALGYTAEELVRLNVADLLTEAAKELFASYIHSLRTTGQAAGRMEVRTLLGDSRIWEYRNVVLSGDPPLVGGMARDVTERTRTIRTLAESETHFRSLVENGPDIIGIVSTVGVICYHSPAAVRALHYAPQELLGTSIVALAHPDDRVALAGVLRRKAAGAAEAERVEIRLRIKNAAWRSFEVVVKPIARGSKVTGLLLTARDVTERKLLEEQLEQAHRVDSLGRLAATVAHEFNNVLMGMLPFAELLQKKAPSAELTARATQHILNSIQRGKRVTHDILRYTQPAQPSIEPLELAKWWMGFLAEAQVLTGDHIRMTASVEPLTVMADVNQLSQVFANLISNARDAMREGGELAVCVRAPRCDEVFAFGYVPDPSRFVQISVSDTGTGMPPDVLRHAFDPLFTTKANGGTGLGLAVTHQVVMRHGGFIFAESVVGEGSTFHIFLPKGTPARRAVTKERTAAITSRRLLIVEDESLIAEGLKNLLGDAGMDIVLASSGREALRVLDSAAPDVVVLDIGLPDLDGTEVARRIREKRPRQPVVFMTGHGDTGNNSMLRKPFAVGELLERIAEAERAT